jgi:hypothetical protein
VLILHDSACDLCNSGGSRFDGFAGAAGVLDTARTGIARHTIPCLCSTVLCHIAPRIHIVACLYNPHYLLLNDLNARTASLLGSASEANVALIAWLLSVHTTVLRPKYDVHDLIAPPLRALGHVRVLRDIVIPSMVLSSPPDPFSIGTSDLLLAPFPRYAHPCA